MENIRSLPDSVQDCFKEVASNLLQSNPSAVLNPADLVSRVMAELARQQPELLVSLLLSQSGFTGVEVIETDETREDQLIEMHDGGKSWNEVRPMITRRTIRREVRFVTGRAEVGRKRR